MSCCHINAKNNIPTAPQPQAFVAGMNKKRNTVDATGSLGDWVRLVVKRNGAVLFTSPAQGYNALGSNQIDYPSTLELQNGDDICVQSSYDFGFGSFAEDCVKIPTPLFEFAGHIELSFGNITMTLPNSQNSDEITTMFVFQDINGAFGYVNLTGSVNAIYSITDANPYVLSAAGIGSETITTAFGNVIVSKTIPTTMKINEMAVAYMDVEDHRGICSVEPEPGLMNAILTEDGLRYLTTESDDIVTFTEFIQPNDMQVTGLKISELPDSAVQPNSGDLFAGVDSAGVTVKMTRESIAPPAVALPQWIERVIPNFSGTELILPNDFNNGEFPANDASVVVFTRGNIDHKDDQTLHDYVLNRGTANAHKLIFTDARQNDDILIRMLPES